MHAPHGLGTERMRFATVGTFTQYLRVIQLVWDAVYKHEPQKLGCPMGSCTPNFSSRDMSGMFLVVEGLM